ncbi:MAG: thioredoxin family protein, partial [Verrucomicrobiota bacterium]
PSSEIKPYHDRFIWAYLDADEEENRALMMRYGVQGIPHLALHDSEGKVVSQLRGAMGPDQLAKELDEVLPADS